MRVIEILYNGNLTRLFVFSPMVLLVNAALQHIGRRAFLIRHSRTRLESDTDQQLRHYEIVLNHFLHGQSILLLSNRS